MSRQHSAWRPNLRPQGPGLTREGCHLVLRDTADTQRVDEAAAKPLVRAGTENVSSAAIQMRPQSKQETP